VAGIGAPALGQGVHARRRRGALALPALRRLRSPPRDVRPRPPPGEPLPGAPRPLSAAPSAASRPASAVLPPVPAVAADPSLPSHFLPVSPRRSGRNCDGNGERSTAQRFAACEQFPVT